MIIRSQVKYQESKSVNLFRELFLTCLEPILQTASARASGLIDSCLRD